MYIYIYIKKKELPCWAEASTTCQTELPIGPKAVSIFGLRPSDRREYNGGQRESKTVEGKDSCSPSRATSRTFSTPRITLSSSSRE